jgi:hypothetical protein
MEERFVPATPAESRPMEASGTAAEPTTLGPGLDDPRALQILSTEHWSLLTARSLVYNEAFARSGMFLAFLSATLLVLGLISTATGFSEPFLIVAAIVLALDLFVGFSTLGRIGGASNEDLRYLQGMNRLRHAYHEMVPGLDRYFITSRYDDFDSVAAFYGPASPSAIRGLLHGLTTAPGMLAVICCALAGALVGVVLLLTTHDSTAAALGALVAFVVLFVLSAYVAFRTATTFAGSMTPLWPAPRDDSGGSED